MPSFADALAKATAASGDKDVMVIGERSMMEAALATGRVDEIYLRIVAKTLGGGTRLIESPAAAPQRYRIAAVRQTASAVHVHMVREQAEAQST